MKEAEAEEETLINYEVSSTTIQCALHPMENGRFKAHVKGDLLYWETGVSRGEAIGRLVMCLSLKKEKDRTKKKKEKKMKEKRKRGKIITWSSNFDFEE